MLINEILRVLFTSNFQTNRLRVILLSDKKKYDFISNNQYLSADA